MAGRSLSKLQESIDSLKADFPDVDYRPLQVDLSSQKSVRAASVEVLSWDDVPVIDIVVNSAGVMMLPERTLSVDGIEMHFAVNHIGHFLLTNLIMPKLIQASEKNPKGATRVVNVSAVSPKVARMRWSDLNFEKTSSELPPDEKPNESMHQSWGVGDIKDLAYIPLEGYNQSKVANVLFGVGVTQKLYAKHGIIGLSLHPGVIVTELGRNAKPEVLSAVAKMAEKGIFEYKTRGAGAATSVLAALDPKLAEGPGETRDGKDNYGTFLADCQINDMPGPWAVSNGQADKLWQMSEDLVKEKFSW